MIFQPPRARLRTRSRGAVCSTLAGRGRESNVTLAQATGSTARSMAFRLSKRLISLNPERHAFTIRAGGTGLEGAIPSYRATLGIRRYQHDELVGDEVGTHFDNDTEDAELMLSHRPFRRLSGTVGSFVPESCVQRHRRGSPLATNRPARRRPVSLRENGHSRMSRCSSAAR